MKKSIVALATLSAIGTAFADVDVSGGIKLYGVLDESVQSQELTEPSTNTSSKVMGLYSTHGTSRLGIKGNRDLGEGTKAHIQVEIELDPDTSTLLPAKNRGTFVGLENATVGVIRLGTQETTAYEVFGMDVNGRVEYKPQVWRATTSSSTQDRANNSIKYISPTLAGFNLHLMTNFSEASSNTAATAATTSVFRSYGLKYKMDKFNAALLQDRISNTYMSYKFAGSANAGVATTNITNYVLHYGGGSITTPVYRNIAAATYDFDSFSVNYLYAKSFQNGSTPGSLTTSTYGIKIPFDKATFAFSIGTGNLDSPNSSAVAATSTTNGRAKDGDITDYTFGGTYAFDKSTLAYVFYSQGTSSVGLYNGKAYTMAVGIRYNF